MELRCNALGPLLRSDTRRQLRDRKKGETLVAERQSAARSIPDTAADAEDAELIRQEVAQTDEERQVLRFWELGYGDAENSGAAQDGFVERETCARPRYPKAAAPGGKESRIRAMKPEDKQTLNAAVFALPATIRPGSAIGSNDFSAAKGFKQRKSPINWGSASTRWSCCVFARLRGRNIFAKTYKSFAGGRGQTQRFSPDSSVRNRR